ncbi:MAG: hypothetical protein KJO78_09465 [Alphaproteobacteria bacterium]|nr:hypothetical protein [Alphaproteobacteria bacterium]
MSEKLNQTIRIKRGEKVGIDDQGHSVWTKPVEEIELELVSTTMLKKIIDSDDEEKKRRIKSLADENDGVLARTPGSQDFEIVSDDELEAALAASNEDPVFHRPADVVVELEAPAEEEELSLVSTQVLRQMLSHDDDAPSDDAGDLGLQDDSGGYNPYDNG